MYLSIIGFVKEKPTNATIPFFTSICENITTLKVVYEIYCPEFTIGRYFTLFQVRILLN